MKYYKTTTKYKCGIDLHTRCMYICVMDLDNNILVHRNIKHNGFEFFLKLVEPYRHDLTVTCESCFVCFWLADADLVFETAQDQRSGQPHSGSTDLATLLADCEAAGCSAKFSIKQIPAGLRLSKFQHIKTATAPRRSRLFRAGLPPSS